MNIIDKLLAAAGQGSSQNHFMEDFWAGMGQGSADTGHNGLLYSAMTRLDKDNTAKVAPLTPSAPQAAAPTAQTYPVMDPDTRVRTLLDFIAKPESSGNYNAVYGNAGASDDLSKKTVNEVLADARRRGAATGSSATGRYQMLSDTMEETAAKLGLTGNEPFTPELQDAMATQLLKRRGLDDYMAGALEPTQFAQNLAKEWAGLPADASGKSYYAGTMNNKAGVSWDAVMQALDNQGGAQLQSAVGAPQAQAPSAGPQGTTPGPAPAGRPAPPQAQEPNFWDRLMMANAAAGSGPGGGSRLSSVMAAAAGTGRGWMPQPEQQVGPGPGAPMSPMDRAKLATEQLRGDKLRKEIEGMDRGKDTASPEQAARDYQVQKQRMQATKANVMAAHERVGGRDVGAVFDRARRNLPGVLGDDQVQADVKLLNKTGVEQMLRDSEYMKGAMTEKEWDILREKVPSPNDPREAWEQFFRDADAMLEDAARRAGYDPRSAPSGGTSAPAQPTTTNIPGIPAGVSQYY